MTDPAPKPLPPVPGPLAPSEPLAPVSLLLGGVGSILALLVAFNVPLTQTQQAAILGVVPFVVAVAVWLWGRRQVFSPKTVRAMVMDEKAASYEAGIRATTSGTTTQRSVTDPSITWD
jgi:hypothetical protein